MKASIKRRWAKRLREMDNDLQVTGFVRQGNKRCVNGVLLDLAVEDGLLQNPFTEIGTGINFLDLDGMIVGTGLSLELMEWAGVKTPDFRIPYQGTFRRSFDLNDLEKLNFDQFASLLHKTKAADIY